MRRLSLLTCAALSAIGLAASPALARPVYGVQGIGTGTKGAAADDLAVAKRLRVHITRIEASWAELEPDGPGRRDPAALATLDHTVDSAARSGIKVVLFVDRTPCWASSAPANVRGGCSGPGRNRRDVTRWSPVRPEDSVPISAFLVARYGAKLAAFEVWNEPDQSNEKYWAGPNKVEKYVALVKALYQPLKRANPKLPVLAGAFVGTNGAWLTAMYQQGVKGFYDGLAVHFYDLPLYALAQTRALQRRFGDTKPMWLNEFGWSSCYRKGGPATEFGHPCVTRAGQAQNLVDLLGALRPVPWVKAAIEFQMADRPGSFQFGLLDAARRAKPLYTTASRLQRGVRLKMVRPRIRITRAGGRLVAQGTASGVDVLNLRVFRGSTLRVRAVVRTNRFRQWRFALPKELGTGPGIRVTARGGLIPGTAQART